ncbi:MAG TPA: 3'-5' exonuclease, partial [Acidimicrobiales bacterium]
FDRVSSDWPGVRILTLPENFRSTPEVVALAEAVRPTPAGAGPATVCRAGHPDGCIAGSPEPGRSRQPPGLLPSIAAHTDDRAEAHAVAAAIAGRRAPGRPWGGMAVLARTNARLRLVAEALTAAGVPWRLRDPRPLADRPDVRSWLDAIPPTAPAADLAEVLADQPAAPDRDALSRALGEFRLTAPGGTVAALAAWLDATGVTADEAPVSGVDLATFHRAKGLEWKSVWVIGLEDGLVPLASSTDPQSLAEERRLLYVALTRAEDEIALSWAARRAAGGGDVACPPSPWLADLAGVAAVLSRQPAPSDQRVRLAALRGAVPAVDAALVRRRRALTAWREARARAARVPPAVILSDEVVRALAGAAPVSESEIVRIGATAGPRVARWAPELVQVLSG